MKRQRVMLYKPDGGVKEYEHAAVVYVDDVRLVFDNLNNNEQIETNLPYLVATVEER